MDDLTAGNPDSQSGGTASATATMSDGTNNQNGEASQSATVSDSFIPEGVDINTLPQNVRAIVDKINKDMVRGFTEKTSKLSETIKTESQKATEAYRSKADLYDQIATQEEFVRQWNEYVQKSQSKSPENQSGDPVLTEMKKQLDDMSKKIQISELSEITEAFASAQDEKGNSIHPDFDTLNNLSIGELKDGEQFSLLRACVELAKGNPQEKLANGYKSAKTIRDAIFEEGRKAGMGRMEKKILNGTNPPSNSSGDVLTVTDKKPKSAREALEMARRGQVVSRD